MTQRTVVIGGELDPLPAAVGTPSRRVDACPLCRSPLHTTLARKAPYELRRCGACGLAYVTPRPSAGTPAGSAAVMSTNRPRRTPDDRGAGELLTWALANGPAGGRAVAAAGAVRELLCDRGFDAPDGGLEVLTDPPNGVAGCDLICLGEVVAEVPDPVELLLRARRRLAPGGRLVVNTADLDSPVTRLRGRRHLHDRHPERLQHFNASTLGRLLDTTGFRLERMTRRQFGRGPGRSWQLDPRRSADRRGTRPSAGRRSVMSASEPPFSPAVAGARLSDQIASISWYHTLELAPGVVTPGWFDHRSVLDAIPLPADLSGQRCLDVGTFNGFWAFELERRGAAEVHAVDVLDPRRWDWPAGCQRRRRSLPSASAWPAGTASRSPGRRSARRRPATTAPSTTSRSKRSASSTSSSSAACSCTCATRSPRLRRSGAC